MRAIGLGTNNGNGIAVDGGSQSPRISAFTMENRWSIDQGGESVCGIDSEYGWNEKLTRYNYFARNRIMDSV